MSDHKYFFSPFIDAFIGIVKTIGYWGSFFLFAYLGIPEEALYLLILLMGIDMGCGVIKAGRLYGGNAITSHRATVGVMKKGLIIIIIVTIAILFKILGGIDPSLSLSGLIALFAIAQAYSIIGNAYSAYTLKILPEFEATGEIFKWLGRLLEARIEKVTKKDIMDQPLDIKPTDPQ